MTPLLRGCARLTLVSVALLAHKFRPEAAADPRLRREARPATRRATHEVERGDAADMLIHHSKRGRH